MKRVRINLKTIAARVPCPSCGLPVWLSDSFVHGMLHLVPSCRWFDTKAKGPGDSRYTGPSQEG